MKDDNLHQHAVQLKGTRKKFKCAECGENMAGTYTWSWNRPPFFARKPLVQCASCEFLICMNCIIGHYGSSVPRRETIEWSVNVRQCKEVITR